MAVNKGDWVAVSYTGTLTDGTVFDQSKDETLKFEVGAGTVIKGFDAAVEGMEVGAEKKFTIPCADAYGVMSDDKKETVPKDFFKDIEPEVGKVFMAQTPMGPLKLKVLTVDDKGVNVSLNHPLAGEDLTFKIKIEEILDGPPEPPKESVEEPSKESEEDEEEECCGGNPNKHCKCKGNV